MTMQNQNLFALLPYDAEDVYYVAAPEEAPAADEEKKHPNEKTNKSKPAKNKTGHQDRSNGYYQSWNGFWGNNRVADGSGSNYNDNYNGSSYQQNYNGEQRLQGFGRGGGYGGRGRSFNEYSNGKQLGNPMKGNQSFSEAESLNKPVAGHGKEAWQVVGAPSRASSVVSEGRSEGSYNPDQTGPYRKGNGDESNDNAVGNVSAEEDEKMKIKREKREKWQRDMEEERKKKTLKQYYAEKEKEKVVPKQPEQPRVVALDKELEAMQLVGKKILPLRKQGSDSGSVTDVKSDKNKEKKDSADKKKACKSIVEGMLKQSCYVPQRYNREPNPNGNAANGSSAKGAPVKGDPSDKGLKESRLEGKGKDTMAEGSNPKGNAAIVVRRDNRKDVERKVVKSAVNVDLKFDDTAQFPALK